MSFLVRWFCALGLVVGAAAVVPRTVCGWGAGAWFHGDPETQDALARHVARSVLAHPRLTFFDSGSSRFDGQSAVAIWQMALLGLGQRVLDDPERRDDYLPAMRVAADRLADPRTLRYAASVYGEHGVVRMDPGEGHAYLGYVNLGLGMLRAVDPGTEHAALNDRLTERLASRLFASSTGMIETYPGESWPPDVAAVAGSIGLHAFATGADRPAELDAWGERFARCAFDGSGFLVQQVRSGTCTPADAPRGSGTAIAAYFLGFSNPELSRQLGDGLTVGHRSFLGFGAIREYAPGHDGPGDIDAGPILFGVSVGATGFGLGAARTTGDEALFRSLYRTADLFGVPVARGDERSFAAGGPLGNALILAMLTARPVR